MSERVSRAGSVSLLRGSRPQRSRNARIRKEAGRIADSFFTNGSKVATSTSPRVHAGRLCIFLYGQT